MIDENGNAVAVWIRYSGGTATLESSIYNAGTNSWSASPVVLFSTTNFFANFDLALQPNSSGNATVIFQESGVIYAQEYTFAGGWSLVNNTVFAGPGAGNISLSISSSGTAVAAWDNSGLIETTPRIAGSWNPVPVAISAGLDTSSQPIVKVNPVGSAVVMWRSDNGGLGSVLKATTGVAGSPSWLPTGLVTPLVSSPTGESLSIDVEGNAIALWVENNSPYPIMASTLASGTSAWVATTDLGLSSSSDVTTNVAFDNLGRAVAFFAASDGVNPPIDEIAFGDFFEINLNPLPPENLRGSVLKNRFLTQTEYNHELSWNASPSPGVVAYKLYRNGLLIATISAGPNSFIYNDHNRRKNEVDTYSVVSVNGDNLDSTPVVIVL